MVFNEQNIMYTIDLKSGECSKSIPPPWRPVEIPPNATFEAELTIGGPGESITVTEWSNRIPLKKCMQFISIFQWLAPCRGRGFITMVGGALNRLIIF